MVTYGSFPGVKVNVQGGAIAGAEVGREQKHFIVALGEGGSQAANETVQIQSRSDADAKFGGDSQLADQYRLARGNGSNPNFIYGVSPEVTEQTLTESGTSTGQLSQAPIIPDSGRITATETAAGTDLTVNVEYGTVSAPSAGEININPATGNWEIESSGDVEIVYDTADYQGALESIDREILENEFGIISLVSKFEEHASTLGSVVTSLRSKQKMVLGLTGAEPNATMPGGAPMIDTANYTDGIATEGVFIAGPVETESGRSVIGALGGLVAGNGLGDPVYRESINGITGMKQRVVKAEAGELRDKQVIPIKDQGTTRVAGNGSTSTESDWERAIYQRRIVDLVNITLTVVGEATIGSVNDQDTRDDLRSALRTELLQLANDDLIKRNTQSETNYFVEVTDTDSDEVSVDVGVSLFGVVKKIPIEITINT